MRRFGRPLEPREKAAGGSRGPAVLKRHLSAAAQRRRAVDPPGCKYRHGGDAYQPVVKVAESIADGRVDKT